MRPFFQSRICSHIRTSIILVHNSQAYVAAFGSSTPSILIKLCDCKPSLPYDVLLKVVLTLCQDLCYAFHVGSLNAGPYIEVLSIAERCQAGHSLSDDSEILSFRRMGREGKNPIEVDRERLT